ncbi:MULTISPECIES: hypothetical protein [unclassified Streptomyces]|uniref:hypothetical protein n=1 Tax=unclassified Streptomyces TaxID=2593676 RepID=UPI002250B5DA|nr:MULTISPECIES: hypothetical protein [unclassified Streptomyces]MCX4992374.1 hypothetical protein [Streptomyces sp. NBC_00568]MCX5002390.1 hypothetical protein [Streptomyces sp. NBC_00638]
MSTPGAPRAERVVTSGTFGTTGRTHADRPAGGTAVRDRLLLPGNTVVPSGHGSDRTVTARRPGVHAT